jgi:hypothetical protein
VLLGDLQKDTAKVMRHERSDRREELVECLHQPFGALVRIETCLFQGPADIRVEELYGPFGDLARGVVVPASELHQFGQRDPRAQQSESCLDYTNIDVGEVPDAFDRSRDQQVFAYYGVDEPHRHPRLLGQLAEGQ